MKKAGRPLISVVLVNWNGKEHLDECLGSLQKQRSPKGGFEIILVDNASTDGSVEFVERAYPAVRVIRNKANKGFAEGCNIGARASGAEFVAFMNTDMRAGESWLEELHAPFLRGDNGLACTVSKSLSWDGKGLDFPGKHTSILGMNVPFRPWTCDKKDYSDEDYLLWGSGGNMLVRREVFLRSGGFDKDYFMYHEDVDFGWRLWVMGYKVLYAPRALVHHKVGGSIAKATGKAGGRQYQYFLLERNTLMTLMKNLDDDNLARALPIVLLQLARKFLVYAGIDWKAFGDRGTRHPAAYDMSPEVMTPIAAAASIADMMPSLAKKRAFVQSRRKRPDAEVFALMDVPLSHFFDYLPGEAKSGREMVRFFGLGRKSSLFRLDAEAAIAGARKGHPDGIKCLLALVDSAPEEVRARFGKTAKALEKETGQTLEQLSISVRLISALGSRLLAGAVPGAPIPPTCKDAGKLLKRTAAGEMAILRERVKSLGAEVGEVKARRKEAEEARAKQVAHLERQLEDARAKLEEIRVQKGFRLLRKVRLIRDPVARTE